MGGGGGGVALTGLSDMTSCKETCTVYYLFVQFSAVTSRGVVMATSYVLGEHAEKLVAAIALKTLQAKYVDIYETDGVHSYIPLILPTPWNRVRREKLIDTQIVKKFTVFYRS